MAHLNDGQLRRLYDEPLALDEKDRSHYQGCVDCRGRFATIAEEARDSAALMTVPTATVDAAAAFERLSARLPAPSGATGPAAAIRRFFSPGPGGIGWRRPAAVGAVAVGLSATLAFTPAIQNLVAVFQPAQIQTVSVARPTQGDISSLQQFSQWGDVKWSAKPTFGQVETAAEAAQATGLSRIQVASGRVPQELQGVPVTYFTTNQVTFSVTFNSKAPQSIQGTTLSMVIGPAEAAVYGDLSKVYAQAGSGGGLGQGVSGASGQGAAEQAGAAGSSQSQSAAIQQALSQIGPVMVVGATHAPSVTSTGASVSDIKKALLATKPGPALTELINDFDNPAGNLPLPIPADGSLTSGTAQVQGVTGTTLGDNTGLGGGVIWIRNGDHTVWGVAGTIEAGEAVAVANALK